MAVTENSGCLFFFRTLLIYNILISVNGLRAIIKKDFFKAIDHLKPDVLCLQETKAQDDEVTGALAPMDGFELYINSAEKKGYSGTAIAAATRPDSVRSDMGRSGRQPDRHGADRDR